jgi:hypothetical protein
VRPLERKAVAQTSVREVMQASACHPVAQTLVCDSALSQRRLGRSVGTLCNTLTVIVLSGLVHAQAPEELSAQLLNVKRVYVDRLTGGETAAQMRDLVISSLQGSKLFVITENADRADTFLRGAAEDLVYSDYFSSSENTNARGGIADSSGAGQNRVMRSLRSGAGESESMSVRERKHEAIATVRLVNKDGDVIWSTTQESNGAKFKGASADVADKITRQLLADYEKLRRPGLLNRERQ